MRFVVADKAVLVLAAFAGVSKAVDMAGANAVSVEVVVESNGAGNDFEARVQQSNDLANWSNVGAGEVISTVGVIVFDRDGISAAYVRLVCDALGGFGSKMVYSAIVETKKL